MHDVGILCFCGTCMGILHVVAWLRTFLDPMAVFFILSLHVSCFFVLICVNVVISQIQMSFEHVFMFHDGCDLLIDLESSRIAILYVRTTHGVFG